MARAQGSQARHRHGHRATLVSRPAGSRCCRPSLCCCCARSDPNSGTSRPQPLAGACAGRLVSGPIRLSGIPIERSQAASSGSRGRPRRKAGSAASTRPHHRAASARSALQTAYGIGRSGIVSPARTVAPAELLQTFSKFVRSELPPGIDLASDLLYLAKNPSKSLLVCTSEGAPTIKGRCSK